MKKIIILMMSALMIVAFTACDNTTAGSEKDLTEKITVAVSIVPEATFVEKVAGDLVEIVNLIPPGNSPANYQPTAAEMAALSDASVYFAMQTPTEEANILPKVSDFNEDIEIVLLRDVVSKAYPLRTISDHHHDEEESGEEHEEEHGEEHEETVDPHIWLSPSRVIVMIQTIADKLSALDSANEETYRANAAAYISELEALDAEIAQSVAGIENKAFLIYHAAYGYFADEYGLKMISLEIDGKQATAAEIQEVIDYAAKEGVSTVYYQEEFDDNQAKTVAEEIGGSVAKVAPLSPDYIQSLKDFVEALTVQGNTD